MYARVVVCTHQDDKVELEAEARAGVIPIVTSTPGYISYGVMVNDNTVMSISQWESVASTGSGGLELPCFGGQVGSQSSLRSRM